MQRHPQALGQKSYKTAHRDDLQSQRSHPLPDDAFQFLGHGVLVGQELLQLPAADHRPQGQLGLAVQGAWRASSAALSALWASTGADIRQRG